MKIGFVETINRPGLGDAHILVCMQKPSGIRIQCKTVDARPQRHDEDGCSAVCVCVEAKRAHEVSSCLLLKETEKKTGKHNNNNKPGGTYEYKQYPAATKALPS